MAKTLKDFLNERQLGPMVVKNPDEQKFIDKHVVAKTADRNGNDDELFKGSKVKMADRPKHRKGYNPGEDEEVYEELKGNQHKIDANKNGKVDAHDFHLLRKKKKVAEAADDAKLAFQLHMAKKREELRKKGQLAKEEAEQIDELSKDTLKKYKEKARNDFYDADDVDDGRRVRQRYTGLKMASKKLAKEEVEELDELSIDTMKSYGDKRARTAFSGGRKPGQSVDAGIKMKSKQSNSLSLARTKINRARDTGSTVLNKEEIEQIDELSPSTMGSYAKKASADFTARKPKMGYDGQLKKMQNRRVGVNRALDKMYGEEAEQIDELSHDTLRRYRMKAKSIGDNEKGDIDYRAKGRELAGRKTYGGRMDGIEKAKVMAKEEAEQIDETAKIVAHLQKRYGDNIRKSHVRSAASDFGVDASKLAKAVRTKLGKNMLDEEQIDEISATTKDAYAQKAVKQLPGLFKKSGETADGARKYYNRKNAVRKIANEEAEQIDELSKKTLASYVKGAANHRSKLASKMNSLDTARKAVSDAQGHLDDPSHANAMTSQLRKQYNKLDNKDYNRKYGTHMALKKLAKEEAEQVDEKLDMKKASMGTVVKDFQKSDAPQFQGKSQKKRQVMAIAAKLSAERGGKPLNKEERLLAKLADISETHKRTMVSVFEKLNEDNQHAFMQACDTADGIEQMLDFSISYRGE